MLSFFTSKLGLGIVGSVLLLAVIGGTVSYIRYQNDKILKLQMQGQLQTDLLEEAQEAARQNLYARQVREKNVQKVNRVPADVINTLAVNNWLRD